VWKVDWWIPFWAGIGRRLDWEKFVGRVGQEGRLGHFCRWGRKEK